MILNDLTTAIRTLTRRPGYAAETRLQRPFMVFAGLTLRSLLPHSML